jgi:hypothetical protein
MDKIISVTEIDVMECIDIEVSGNHYFYANDILTHNSNSDVGLEDTSESFGLPATADFMIALITSEELQALNQIMVKQLKNRYGDPNYYKKFVVGINRAKMKLYDVEESAQEDIVDDRPVMDKSDYGHRYEEESKPKPKFNKPTFKDFK